MTNQEKHRNPGIIIKLIMIIGYKIKQLFVAVAHWIASIPYRKIFKGILNFFASVLHVLLFKLLLPRKYRNLSKRDIYTIIFKSDTPSGKRFDIVVLVLIGINIILLLVDSFPGIPHWLRVTLRALEWTLTVIFTFEYYLRVYCLNRPSKYVFSFYGIIDFISIFPAYLSLFIPATQTISVLRILRTLRVFRILKMQRFVIEGSRLLNSIRRSMYKIVIFMMFVFIVAVILGALMYMCESSCNPAFTTIPQGIYWAVVTITTVGYGDITPVTYAGRFISMIVMLLGYSIIAVPTGIVVGEVVNGKDHKYAQRNNTAFTTDESEAIDPAVDPGDPAADSHAPLTKHCSHCGYCEPDLSARYCSRCGTPLSGNDEHIWINDFFSRP